MEQDLDTVASCFDAPWRFFAAKRAKLLRSSSDLSKEAARGQEANGAVADGQLLLASLQH